MQVSKRKPIPLPPLPKGEEFRRTSKKEGFALTKQRREYREESKNSGSGRDSGLVARGMLTAASASCGGALSSAAAVAKALGTSSALAKPAGAPTIEKLEDAATKAYKDLARAMPSGLDTNALDLTQRQARASCGRIKRLMMEAKKCTKRSESERELHAQLEVLIGDDLSEWQAILKGPDDPHSPYSGGTWRLMIRFLEDYPSRAPDVYFVTPILHLNVDGQGKVCHSALDREYMPSGVVLIVPE
jgi:ubiquitin-protein ligase